MHFVPVTMQALDMLRLSQAEDGEGTKPAARAWQASLEEAASAGPPGEASLAAEGQSEPHSTQQEDPAKHAPYEPDADEQETLLSDSSPQQPKKCALLV